MAHDLVLNEIIKRMYALDEKLLSGISLTSEELDFYDLNLSKTKRYYMDKNEYWQGKTLLEK